MSTIRKQIWIKATTKNKRPKFDEAAIFCVYSFDMFSVAMYGCYTDYRRTG